MTGAHPRFEDFFRACSGHDPFPWQAELACRMAEANPPQVIAVPTGLGKTATILAWVWALATTRLEEGRQVPLRLVHVSPRRVIVDQTAAVVDRVAQVMADPTQASDEVATEAARRVAERLLRFTDGEGSPLVSARLRGGIRPEPTWKGRLDQPVAIAATSDLAGSGFLFRFFTGSASARPVIAGLLGVDSCWVLDEAHLQEPLRQTLMRCREAEQASPLRLPWWLIESTATPQERSDVLGLTKADYAHPVVKARLDVERTLHLHEVQKDSELAGRLVELAQRAADNGARAVLVVTDTVERARTVFDQLRNARRKRADGRADQVLLLHGQQREHDRTSVLTRAEEAFSMKHRPPTEGPTTYLVATNAIEVGADLSADHLVTVACPGDSLLQRLGRLGRRADARRYACDVVAVPEPKAEDEGTADAGVDGRAPKRRKKGKETVDPYKIATLETIKRLCELGAAKGKATVTIHDPQGLDKVTLAAPGQEPMPLSSVDLRALIRTRPDPTGSPDIDALIHGIGDPDDPAYLAWRDDLVVGEEERWAAVLEAWPLRSHETLSVPAWALRRWLGNDADDRESAADAADAAEWKRHQRPFLVWEPSRHNRPRAHLVGAGADDRRVVPGTIVVVPSSYGGHDDFGFAPAAKDPVRDLADLVTEHPKGPRLRLRRHQLPEECAGEFDKLLQAIEDPDVSEEEIEGELRRILGALTAAEEVDYVLRQAADRLEREGRLEWELHGSTDGRDEGTWIAVTTRRRALDDDDELCLTVEVGLDEHHRDVAARAAAMAQHAGVPRAYVEAVRLAGQFHDAGKADERFQASLRGGRMRPSSESPIAKSMLPRRRWQQAASDAGLPSRFRHEALSRALVEKLVLALEKPLVDDMPRDDLDALVAHLVGASHGWGRPWFPPVARIQTDTSTELTSHGHTVTVAGNPLQNKVPTGLASRFVHLNHTLGPWSLAWLEAAVRLADQAASASYQRR